MIGNDFYLSKRIAEFVEFPSEDYPAMTNTRKIVTATSIKIKLPQIHGRE